MMGMVCKEGLCSGGDWFMVDCGEEMVIYGEEMVMAGEEMVMAIWSNFEI